MPGKLTPTALQESMDSSLLQSSQSARDMKHAQDSVVLAIGCALDRNKHPNKWSSWRQEN